jgi:alpha-D-xyloside xylohydrolase
VEIDLDPFNTRFYGPDGTLLLAQNSTDTEVSDLLLALPLGYSELGGQQFFHESFTAEPDEHYYGFGEKFTDFDKRGQTLELWHYDAHGVHGERAYKNVPFFVSSRGYGVFLDTGSLTRFDMAASSHTIASMITTDNALDYYVIAGPSLKDIIRLYSDLVGHPILPPKWSMGLWMSSGFKRDSADEVAMRARELREHDIPADVLHLDCYWQRWGCWSDNQWDTEMFPDPAGLIKRVKDQNFRVCLWINSYIGIESPLLKEAEKKGYLLKTKNGKPWIGQLWGGYHPPVALIDVTNPAAGKWLQGLLRPHLEMGADVYKTDFGEGVPREVFAYNGMTGEELHNIYPLLYNDLVAEVTREVTGGPGLVWGRSTWAGGQRHAAQWGGDPNCTYQGMMSTLRGGLSMAMCGHAFWSHDMGGFHHTPTPDVYVRWSQMGFFSPMSRAHGMSSRLPWDYGETAERIFRDYDRLRYRLAPYIYSYYVEASETGLPVIRPMVLEFEKDPTTYTMDLQYMFGEHLLIAPVYNREGKVRVYLPEGQWVDYRTHAVYSGPNWITVQAGLDVLPIYVRAGALIPTVEPPDYFEEKAFDFVTFDAYVLGNGDFRLHDTDGETTVHVALESGVMKIAVEGAKKKIALRLMPLPGAGGVDNVHVNGKPLARNDNVTLDASSKTGWTRGPDGILRAVIQL